MINLQDNTTTICLERFHLQFRFKLNLNQNDVKYRTYNEIISKQEYYYKNTDSRPVLEVDVIHSIKVNIDGDELIFWASIENINITNKIMFNMDHFIKTMKKKCKKLLVLHIK